MTDNVSVGQISSSHISKLIAVEGRINKIWPIKVKLTVGAFKCKRCDHVTIVPQPITDKLIKPDECGNDVCGGKGHFDLRHEESEWIDEQKIELRDFNEVSKPGQPERNIIVLVRGSELIDTIPALDAHVVITGTIRVVDNEKSSIYDKVLEADHIETIEIGKSQRDRLRVLKGIIRNLQEEHHSAVPLEDIISRAEEAGIKKDTVEDLIQTMKTVGEVLEASNERFRVV